LYFVQDIREKEGQEETYEIAERKARYRRYEIYSHFKFSLSSAAYSWFTSTSSAGCLAPVMF